MENIIKLKQSMIFHPSQRRYHSVLGMTQSELARRARVSVGIVHLFCYGKLSNDQLRKHILSILGIPFGREKQLLRRIKANVNKEAEQLAKSREKKRHLIIEYLRMNPDCHSGDLKKAGLGAVFSSAFGRNMNRARQAAGIPQRTFMQRAERRTRLLEYLRTHPEATITRIKRDGYYQDLGSGYKNQLSEARIDAGLHPDEPARRRKKRLSRQRAALLAWLKRNPLATLRVLDKAGFAPALRFFFSGRISDAKRAAAISAPYPGHVSAAEAARRLKVSREYARQLFYSGALEGFRRRKFIFVKEQSIRKHKALMKTKRRRWNTLRNNHG